MKKLFKPIIILLVIVIGGILLVKPTLDNISYGIDLKGGFEILYRVEPLEKDGVINEDSLSKTYSAIVDRIDTLGVSEPVITVEGENLIRVQLPGVSNEEEARERISTTAVLSFRDVNDNLLMTSEVLDKGGARAEVNSQMPGKYLVSLDIKDTSKFYEVTKNVSQMVENNIIVTWLDFEEGVDSFNEYGRENCNDMKCLSAANVNEGLNSSTVTITGNFTKEEAELLAEYINNGYGRKILQHLINCKGKIFDMLPDRIYAGIDVSNERCRHLFMSLGFKQVGQTEDNEFLYYELEL